MDKVSSQYISEITVPISAVQEPGLIFYAGKNISIK